MSLPATFPLWMAAFGAIFAIVVGKQMYGGLGRIYLIRRCWHG
ncbi:RnfABCDGE type electron transport complex subunit D [Vibrio sp. PP-XX7]